METFKKTGNQFPEDERNKILVDNAVKLFKLDLA